MHIGIDGYEINAEKLVGVGTWGFEIVKNLYNIDRQNRYTIFLPSSPKNLPPERENWEYRVIPAKGFWTFTSLPFGIWTNKKLDVFFSPTHYIPRFVKVPRIVSIMDLSYLHYPQLFNPKDSYQLQNWTAYSIKNSQKIITISQFTKSEIVKYYNVSPEKIVVACPGLNEIYLKHLKGGQAIRHLEGDRMDSFQVEEFEFKEYLLFVGTLQPRKNLSRLIDAFNLASQGLALENLKLVIVGKKGWLYEDIFHKASQSGLKSRLKFLDYVNEERMPDLYKGAKCLVLPSLYEGFGIPVIEAMACGTLTVISNTSSLPEVGGDASIYVDPENIESIKKGMIKALSLNEKEKKALIQKGYDQIKKFSWTKSAKIVLQALKDIK